MLNRTKSEIESIIRQMQKDPKLLEIGAVQLYDLGFSDCKDETRTPQQNKGIHKDCDMIAKKLREKFDTLVAQIKRDIKGQIKSKQGKKIIGL